MKENIKRRPGIESVMALRFLKAVGSANIGAIMSASGASRSTVHGLVEKGMIAGKAPHVARAYSLTEAGLERCSHLSLRPFVLRNSLIKSKTTARN